MGERGNSREEWVVMEGHLLSNLLRLWDILINFYKSNSCSFIKISLDQVAGKRKKIKHEKLVLLNIGIETRSFLFSLVATCGMAGSTHKIGFV